MHLLFLIAYFVIGVSSGHHWREKQSVLLKNLTENVDSRVDPALDSSTYVNVDLNYGIYAIIGIDERAQILKLTSFVIVSWYDPDLTWSQDQGNPKKLTVPNKDIWTPDLFMTNDIEDTSIVDIKNGKSILNSDGTIYTIMYRRTSTTCHIDAARFPFDTQTCYIVVAPRNPTSNIHLVISDEVILQLTDQNNEWHLVNVTFLKDYKTVKNRFYHAAVAKIVLRRRALFHVLKSVIPSVLMSFINVLVFWMPANSGERMAMAISSFLSYTIYVTYIYESLPANSDTVAYFPVYLCWMMIQSGLIIAATVASLHFHDQRKESENQETSISNDSFTNNSESANSAKETTCNNGSLPKLLLRDNKVRPFRKVEISTKMFCRRFDLTCFSLTLGLSTIAMLWLLFSLMI